MRWLKGCQNNLLADRVLLIIVLQQMPLQFQASHQSFQESFTVVSISSSSARFPDGAPKPLQWPVWFANVVGSDASQVLPLDKGCASELESMRTGGGGVGSLQPCALTLLPCAASCAGCRVSRSV